MDLIKIGRYIAEKRKALNLTQRQLAEQLGMSDKSVSKWERGVCLPDVSVYSELCTALGISLNEFLAGEDIAAENVIMQSEENILVVATDSKLRQKRLKRLIGLLLAVTVCALAFIGAKLYLANRPQNFICPVDRESVEMKTAELLSGMDGAFLYRYAATDGFSSLKLYISRYESGKRVSKENMEISYEGMCSPSSGMILIVPDFRNFTVKLIVADEGSKLATDIPILEGVEDRLYYGRSASQIEGKVDIQYDEEQALLALIYDNDAMRVIDLRDMMDGKTRALSENDYVYFFSFQFCK